MQHRGSQAVIVKCRQNSAESNVRPPRVPWALVGVFGLLLALLVPFAAEAQETTNVPALEAFARQAALKAAADKQAVEEWARQHGVPIRRVFPDGRVVEIMRLENGRPVYYTTTNAVAADTVSTDELWPGGSSGLDLSGAGITSGVWDGDAVFVAHNEFGGRAVQQDGAANAIDHATHVAGTMIAVGQDANAKGMAFAGNLDCYDWSNDTDEMASAAASGLLVSNHSYGTAAGWEDDHRDDGNWAWLGDSNISGSEDWIFGFYNSIAQGWDQIAYDAPFYLICKSAGNDRNDDPGNQPIWHWEIQGGQWAWVNDIRDPDGGATGYDTLPTYAVAKNILTVGAVHDIVGGYNGPGSVQMAAFSGWGPADDGRIKPDVCGNGVSLWSCIAQAPWYGWISGTSMATPNVSGSLGLLIGHYQATHGGADMRAATLKALVIHTADECGPNDGPDYSFGWGLFNATTAAEVISEDADLGFTMIELTLHDQETYAFSIESAGTGPLRVTIAWTDPPGTPPGDSLDPPNLMLVNDLDLRVTGHSGDTYFPWVLDSANPANPATTGVNSRDNIEQVYVASPGAGTYTVQITHKGTLDPAGTQAFSLIITGAEPMPWLELSPQSHDFGEEHLGDCTPEFEFTLENVGSGPGSAVGRVKLTGADKDHFDITQGSGNFSMLPGDRRTIKVEFCPTTVGDKHAILLADGTNCNDASSHLYGTCIYPTTEVMAPNGGEQWAQGTEETIEWTYEGTPGNVKIELYESEQWQQTLDPDTPCDGSYDWDIIQPVGEFYKIRITSLTYGQYGVWDESNGYFSIVEERTITVTSPNGGEEWERHTEQTITWDYTGDPGNVKIELYKGGQFDRTINPDTACDGSYDWYISPYVPTGTDYKVRITSLDYGVADESNMYFSIIEHRRITVIAPNGGEEWEHGFSYDITWSWTGDVGNYLTIDVYKGGSWVKELTGAAYNDGVEPWTVSSDFEPGTDYKIRITSNDHTDVWDESDSYFAILETATITVTAPNGKEKWVQGTSETITWDWGGDPGDDVKIDLYTADVYDCTLDPDTPCDGSYVWQIPAGLGPGTDYKIRITSLERPEIWDESDMYFYILSSIEVWYVDCTVSQSGDGTSWAQAFKTLQEGIDGATPYREVWVADGVYVDNIVMGDGVRAYGGFEGDEGSLDERDWVNNVTTIDGSQSGTCVTMVIDSEVDGFEITNGSGTTDQGKNCGGGVFCQNIAWARIANCDIHHNTVNGWGGGVYCTNSAPEITACKIHDNSADDDGGGVYCVQCAPIISGSDISHNEAANRGGGIACYIHGNPEVTNNTIRQNSAKYGGGIDCSGAAPYGGSSPTVLGNTIAGNWATWRGGGICCGHDSSPIVANNVIYGNTAATGGGFLCDGSASTIVNNTIVANHACSGGGIWCYTGSPVEIVNNIVAFGASGITVVSGPSVTIDYNCVYGNALYDYDGCSPGANDISEDPMLASVAFGNLHIQWYSPVWHSPCIDAGNNSYVVGEFDIDGQARIQGPQVDIGADESDHTEWDVTPDVVCVSPGGDDQNDGSSWELAKQTVQAGIDALSAQGGEVWVEAGEYYERVTLAMCVYVYGGFDGTETERPQRDWVTNTTVLDGQQGGSVVTAVGMGYLLSAIDGFTIQGGSAADGGGIYCSYASPCVTNNTIKDNFASSRGGGICCDDSAPSVTYNTITGNSVNASASEAFGGGVFCTGCAPYVAYNTITWNTVTSQVEASYGGGVCCYFSSATVEGNTITDNTVQSSAYAQIPGGGGGVYCGWYWPLVIGNLIARNTIDLDWGPGYGGGIFCQEVYTRDLYTEEIMAAIVNNVVFDNEAEKGGGVYIFYSGYSGESSHCPLILVNNTICANEAARDGGGLCCDNNSYVWATNSIFWENTTGWQGPQISVTDGPYGNSPSTLDIDYSDVRGGQGSVWVDPLSRLNWGPRMINADPLFVNSGAGDFHLTAGSPCLDTGDNSVPLDLNLETDWELEERIFDGDGDQQPEVDMGADEYVPYDTQSPDPQPEGNGPLFGGYHTSGFPAWVWFSIPLTPDCPIGSGCADPNTLLGFDCSGNLFYWDKYGKFAQVYNPPFIEWDLAVGDSYLLYLDQAVPTPGYAGLSPFLPWTFEFKLGKIGWTWIGMPGEAERTGDDFMSSVTIKYPSDETGEYRTALGDYTATPDNWLTWGWHYWNTWAQSPEVFTAYAPFGHRTCYPWIGYRVWVNVGTAADEAGADQVTLIWPKVE